MLQLVVWHAALLVQRDQCFLLTSFEPQTGKYFISKLNSKSVSSCIDNDNTIYNITDSFFEEVFSKWQFLSR